MRKYSFKSLFKWTPSTDHSTVGCHQIARWTVIERIGIYISLFKGDVLNKFKCVRASSRRTWPENMRISYPLLKGLALIDLLSQPIYSRISFVEFVIQSI